MVCDSGIGTHANSAIGLSKKVGPRGRVFAFEPVSGMHANLRRELAGYANVDLVAKGLWHENGEIEMFLAGDV